MALQNDFLPFATGGGANVLSQSAYAALAAVSTGYQSGVASSAALNKTWRQSSIMSAVLALMINNNAGQPAVDDGTTANLLANLTTAISVIARQNPVLADTGTANNYVVANLAAFTAYPTGSGLTLDVSIANTNTGASTLNVDGLGTKPILGLGLQPLQGGELVQKGVACLLYVVASTVNGGNGAWMLTECSGGAQQVAPATQSKHAPQMWQVTGIVGSARNLKMSVAAASASATLTADEIVVETALGGIRYCLANFSSAVNLGTTGAGGMDTGSAPVSGYVALYAIYNPTTGTSALLATNATSSAAPSIYGGANMPSGYTASALVSVWPTNGSSQFAPGLQIDRLIGTLGVQVLSTSTQSASLTSLNIASAVPPNARKVQGIHSIGSTTAQSGLVSAVTGATSGGSGVGTTAYNASNNVNTGGATAMSFSGLPIATPQTIFYSAASSLGTMSYTITITGYEF